MTWVVPILDYCAKYVKSARPVRAQVRVFCYCSCSIPSTRWAPAGPRFIGALRSRNLCYRLPEKLKHFDWISGRHFVSRNSTSTVISCVPRLTRNSARSPIFFPRRRSIKSSASTRSAPSIANRISPSFRPARSALELAETDFTRTSLCLLSSSTPSLILFYGKTLY